MVVKINEVRGKNMKKHSLKDIEKVYHQCKVNNENMKESDVKFKQIPNVLISNQTLKRNTKKIAFCEECRKDVEYTVSDVPITGKTKDVEYHCVGKEARCVNCHNRLYVPEINDYNLDMLYKVRNSKNSKVK